jgi:hypothetical protein
VSFVKAQAVWIAAEQGMRLVLVVKAAELSIKNINNRNILHLFYRVLKNA